MNIIEALSGIILALISSAGYLGIFAAMLVEGILTPIPSELIMPFAGYLSSTGQLNIVLVILVGSLGATVGSTVAYLLGRSLGRQFLDRWGRYFGLGPEAMCKADAWFAKWGSYGVLLGHAMPGVRSIISFPAGIARMDIKRFAVFTFLGASIWNSVLVVAGFALGEYWMRFAQTLDGWDLVLLISFGTALAAYIAYKRWKTHSAPRCEENG